MGECLRQEFSEMPWVWHHPRASNSWVMSAERTGCRPLQLSQCGKGWPVNWPE